MDEFLDYIIHKECGYFENFFKIYILSPKCFLCKNKQLDCSICLSKIKSTEYILDFQCHSFHKKCINKWLKINNNCPLCRRILK
jgi:hypothetical protein